jgi:hypothetical protein
MATWAAVVNALYEELGSWPAVAEACGGRFSPMTYWKIGSGQTVNPSMAVCRGVKAAAEARITGLTAPRLREKRGGLVITLELRNRLAAVKSRQGWTWEQTLGRAAELLEEEERCKAR